MNRLTLTVLTLLALGIWANALIPLLRPTPVKADSIVQCIGTLDANGKLGYLLGFTCR